MQNNDNNLLATKFYVAAHGLIRKYGDAKYLVTKRSADNDYMPNKWDIPGGTIDAGETAIMALKREIHEETRLDIDKIDIKYVYTNLDPLPDKQYFQIVFECIMYICQPDAVVLDSEHSEYKWLTINEMNELDLMPFVRETLARADLSMIIY